MAPPEPQIAALDQLGVALRDSLEQPRPRDRVRVTMAVALAVLAFTTVIVATPPGRAAAEWFAELIGISDDTKSENLAERLSNGTLIATESAPDGEQYVVYADQDSDEGLCFHLVWPGDRGLASCQPAGIRDDVAVPIVSNLVPGMVTVGGLAPAGTAKVEVTYQRSPGAATEGADARVYSLGEPARRGLRTPSEQDYAFLVAFLPDGIGDVAGSSRAEVIAYDEGGRELGRSSIRWVQPAADQRLPMLSCTDGNRIAQRFCAGESPSVSSPEP